MREKTLILLKEAQKYYPHFDSAGHTLSSHLTMTMMAMDAMQESAEKIERYFLAYIPKLKPIVKEDGTINRDNFHLFLGQEDHFYAYWQFFRAELSQHGLDRGLPQWLTALASGLATAAFHPLIRLAYGIELLAVDKGLALEEIAISLAYLADSYQPLALSLGEQKRPFYQEVDWMQKNYQPGVACQEAKMLNEKLACVSADPNFIALVKPMEFKLQDIEVFTRCLYLQASSIHSLHGITAAYAFGKLQAYLGNDPVVLVYFGAAIMALYCAIACPGINLLEEKEAVAGDPWADILNKALQSADEHTIKLVYVCYQYEQAQLGRAYLPVAKRVLATGEAVKTSFWYKKPMQDEPKPIDSAGGFPCGMPPITGLDP